MHVWLRPLGVPTWLAHLACMIDSAHFACQMGGALSSIGMLIFHTLCESSVPTWRACLTPPTWRACLTPPTWRACVTPPTFKLKWRSFTVVYHRSHLLDQAKCFPRQKKISKENTRWFALKITACCARGSSIFSFLFFYVRLRQAPRRVC
jgi:hypothetical protein